MVVEFAHRDAVRPCRPLRARAAFDGAAEDGRSAATDRDGVIECLLTGGADGRPGEGCGGHGGIVDHAVDDHVDDVGVDLDRVGGDLGEMPRELPCALEVLVAAVHAQVVDDGHAAPRSWGSLLLSRPSTEARMLRGRCGDGRAWRVRRASASRCGDGAARSVVLGDRGRQAIGVLPGQPAHPHEVGTDGSQGGGEVVVDDGRVELRRRSARSVSSSRPSPLPPSTDAAANPSASAAKAAASPRSAARRAAVSSSARRIRRARGCRRHRRR